MQTAAQWNDKLGECLRMSSSAAGRGRPFCAACAGDMGPALDSLCLPASNFVGIVNPAFNQPRTPALPLQIVCHLLGFGNQLHPTGLHQPALTLSHRTAFVCKWYCTAAEA